MSDLTSIIQSLEAVAEHPWQEVVKAKARSQKVIGCVPYFIPLELVHAAGMHPIELWGDGTPTGAAGSYYPAFYCSLLFTLMEKALDGSYDELDGVIVPTTCDGLRNLEENWKYARPEMGIIDYVQPAIRTGAIAHDYHVDQLKRIARGLERISGESITERAMRESINLYNRQRQAMRRFSELAAKHTDIITPTKRQAVFAAARSMPVEEHTELVERLNDQLASLPSHSHSGVALVTTGILLDSRPLLALLEQENIAIVGDLNISESIRYNTDVPGRIDPFDSLALLWENVRGASIALDPKKERGEMLIDLARERGAQGILACIVKFCEEEEFDVPVLMQQCRQAGVPFLALEMETQGATNEQAATRIQAFTEMLDVW